MAKGDLDNFLEALMEDEALFTMYQESIMSIEQSASQSTEEALHSIVALGKENEYEFTASDLKEMSQNRANINQGELSDADLESVAGGCNSNYFLASLTKICQRT